MVVLLCACDSGSIIFEHFQTKWSEVKQEGNWPIPSPLCVCCLLLWLPVDLSYCIFLPVVERWWEDREVLGKTETRGRQIDPAWTGEGEALSSRCQKHLEDKEKPSCLFTVQLCMWQQLASLIHIRLGLVLSEFSQILLSVKGSTEDVHVLVSVSKLSTLWGHIHDKSHNIHSMYRTHVIFFPQIITEIIP